MAERVVELRTQLKDALRFRCLTGTEELGLPFAYHLEVLADDPSLAIEKLLGTPVGVSFKVFGGKTRNFHGRVGEIRSLEAVGGDVRWELLLRPWTWFLSRTADCRIFQTLSAIEIVKTVFKKYPISVIDDRLRGSYATRDYCVQYRETDLAFVSRLLEDEGVTFWFTQDKEQHKLVLADNNDAFDRLPDYTEIPFYLQGSMVRRERDHHRRLDPAALVQPGTFTHTSFDFEKPRSDLMAKRAAPAQSRIGDGRGVRLPGGASRYRGWRAHREAAARGDRRPAPSCGRRGHRRRARRRLPVSPEGLPEA